MAIVVTNDGLELIADTWFNDATAQDHFRYRLFTNDVTPTATSVYSTFTAAVNTAEGHIVVGGGEWTIDADGGVATATASEITFTVNDSETYYGYFVSNASNSLCLWAERFSEGPFSYPSSGGELSITPKLQFQSPI